MFLFFSISWQVAGRLGFEPGNKMDWDTVTAWGSEVLSDRKLTVLPEVTSQTYSMMLSGFGKNSPKQQGFFGCFVRWSETFDQERTGVLCDVTEAVLAQTF